MKPIICSVLLIIQLIEICSAYRILGLIPFSSRSHYINMQPILRELAERGHDVTVLTVFKEDNPPPNYKEVVGKRRVIWEYLGETPDLFALEKISFREMVNLVWDGVYFTNEAVLNTTSVREFIKNDKSHYDLIFVEVFYQESLYMFAHKYNAPIVGISTNGYNLFAGRFLGNPNIISYMAHEFTKYSRDMTFLERMSNTFAYVYDIYWRHYYVLPMHQKIAEEYFGPGPLPQLSELESNISLYLINTHFSYDAPKALIPGIVEIGGVHIQKPKPLPSDLKAFIEGAKDGVIFFSLGSNMNAKDMPIEKTNMFLKTFSRLKQRVIWKYEGDDLEVSDNVLIQKWLPQNDILAHPNIKLFITHGGLLSTQEAAFHGVPVLGFPFYGDQFLNLNIVKGLGYGLHLLYSELTEEILENILKELLDDPKYMIKAKEVSNRFRDRPSSALDTAVFWIEYVIRNKGAPYMRSPIKDLSMIEYLMLDVVAFVLFVNLIVLFVSYKIIKYIVKKLTTKERKKEKRK